MDGGNPGGSSAGLFLPPGQGAVAGRLGDITNPFANQSVNALNAMGGTTPAALAYPYVTGTTSNILNNPFAGGPVQGAQDALGIFRDQINPYTYQAAPNLAGLAGLGVQDTAGVYNSANNPLYGQAGDVGSRLSPDYERSARTMLGDMFNPYVRNAIGQGNTAGANLVNAGSSILNTAFDPQRDLYNRTQSQVSDQVNAQLANSGLAGSPYGASVAGNTLSNFNLDWQDRQLGRMTQGGQAAAGLDTSGVGLMLNPSLQATTAAATDLSSATGAGQAALSSLLTPANNRIAAQLEGASGIGELGRLAQLGYSGAIGDVNSLAAGAQSFGAGPYNAYQGVQGNNFGALQNEISLGNQNYVLPQQTFGDIMQYLGLGQSASGLANTIGATNFGENAQAAQGAGMLGLGGLNALSGNRGFGGSGGAFGTGGFLGSQGPLFGSAADASIASGGPPLAAGGSGFLDSLAAAAPLAMSA